MIANRRKTRNSHLIDTRNQNQSYGTLLPAGKTLHDESQTLSALGMKQDSKLILLGRKVIHCVCVCVCVCVSVCALIPPPLQHTEEQEQLLRPLSAVLKTVDGVKTKMDAISEEIEGIEKACTHFTHSLIVLCVCIEKLPSTDIG